MKGKIWIMSIGFGVLLCPLFGHTQEILSSGAPLAIVEQIYETPEFLPLINLDKAKATLQDLATSLQKMQIDYEQVDQKRNYLEERFGNMTKSIEVTIDATEKNKQLVTDTLTKISLLENNISKLKEELKILKHDLGIAREQVSSYILFLYQSYQGFYGTNDTFSVWKQFLGGRAIDVGLTAQQFAEMLTNALDLQLEEIKKRQSIYSEKTKELNTAKISYLQAAKSLQKDLERLEEQKQYLYAQLRSLQADKSTLDQQAAALSRTKEEMTTQVDKAKKMTLETQGSTSEQVASLLKLPDRPVGRNYFTWPILPPKYISTYYGDLVVSAGEEKKVPSSYMRFELPQGEFIYASAPGLVHSVAQGDFMTPSQVVVLYKQGLITIYTPLEEIFVQAGDLVRRGQVIGTVGGQPGTKGAGSDSLFPHVDYYLFSNAESKHPFDYLDISVLTDEQTPEAWKQKRLDDLYTREVPLQDFGILPGETIAERRDAFLRRYAYGPYANAGLWYDAAEGQGVDPLLGMCVGFAETGFKNFKTPNNIGNVGNNDRGDEVEFVSPLVGARALYSVLNNKYLGGYHTLNELSRFGNNDGFIYASSPYNRQRNVMRCLSSIYGYPIPEDFPFRRPK